MVDSDCELETKVTLVEISGRFDQMLDKIETVKDKQDEMAEDITKIREAVYHPDAGIYARIRALEQWKQTSTRLLWIVTTALVGLSTTLIWTKLFK